MSKFTEKLHGLFGYYTPPEYIQRICGNIQNGPVSFFKKTGSRFFLFLKKNRKICIGLLCVFAAVLAGLGVYTLRESRLPRLIELAYNVMEPVPYDFETKTIGSLWIVFTGSAAPIGMEGGTVSSGITLKPEIQGSWKWTTDQTLVFTPAEKWKLNTTYQVHFAPGLFPSHIKVPRPSFSFTTENFDLDITSFEFYIDPEESSVKRVAAAVTANYPIDTASFESRLSMKPDIKADSGSFKKKNYDFTVSYSDDGRNAYIVSEPVGTPAANVLMKLIIAKGTASPWGGTPAVAARELYAEIPGMTNYVCIQDVSHELIKNPDQRYEQILICSARGDVSAEDLLKNISVYMLPRDRPELPGIKEWKNESEDKRKNYAWYDTGMVIKEVLDLSEPVPLEIIQGEKKYNSENSFRFNAVPGRFIYIRVAAGTPFYGGYYLSEDYETTLKVEEYPRELSIVSEGSILSLSGDKKLSLFSRGISQVTYKIGRVIPEDINHLISQSNGNLNSFRFNSRSFSDYNVTRQYEEKVFIPVENARDLKYFSFSFADYLKTIPSQNLRYGIFIFSAEGGNKSDKRLIMVTDLGFFVKTNQDRTADIFVQSIADGKPVAAANVSIIGLNGTEIFSAQTGSDGHIAVPDMSSYSKEYKPTAFVVRKGDDMSFMPYSSEGRRLDYSGFDIGGEYGMTDPDKINAYLFSDRGIYRPGDTFNIGMIIKSGDWKKNFAGTPLEYTVVDPNGMELCRKPIMLSSGGFEEISYRTQEYSPTGIYQIRLYVIRRKNNEDRRDFLGSADVKVEEFLPDNLKIAASLRPVPVSGWINPQELTGSIVLRNLFGTAAEGNSVKAQITLTPGRQYFKEFKDYYFEDPYDLSDSYTEFLGDGVTDAAGECHFPIDISKFKNATYNLRFNAEAFEKGSGRSVSCESSLYVSPLKYLIGYKSDGSLSYIPAESKRTLSFIAVNSEAKASFVQDIKLAITESRYVSMLVKQPNGLYKYQSVRTDSPVKEEIISIPAGGLVYELPASQSGEFTLTLTGADGLVYNSLAYSVIGDKNVQRNLSRTAELEMRLDKADYKNGETARLFIKAPYAGSGLITVERDKVYSYKWFSSEGLSTETAVPIPGGLEANGYISVVYLRDRNSDEIYMSPLCYGAVPFSVSMEQKKNPITLDIPAEAKPGQVFTIRYSSEKPARIAIAAVNEGILQVAGYQTPDPFSYFFKKRALEVGTAQIMDLVLPEYSVVRSLAAMGGGMYANEALSRNLNPFKRKNSEPVAFWSGIIDCGPEPRSVEYTVPDYFNGMLRVTAVAVSGDSIGVAQDSSLIRSTFIISPNTPSMAAPGDEFDVSVTVTNNQNGAGDSGTVRLEAKTSEHISIVSQSKFVLDIPEGKDKTVEFRVKANNILGSAELLFEARGGGDVSALTSTLSVRPAVPYRVELYSGALKKSSAEIPVDRRLYEDFASRTVSLSYLPLSLADGLYFYLSKYPYGCSEQLISAVFPSLFPSIVKETGITKQEADAGVNRVISVLQSRQKNDGSIGLWTYKSPSDLYITSYAVHFLLTAREKGYYVSQQFLDSCLSSLISELSEKDVSLYNLTGKSYAVYVLTLAGNVTTQYIEKIKTSIKRSYPSADTEFAGLFLAGSYAMLQQKAEADSQISRISRQFKRDDSYRYVDSLSYSSLYLVIIAKHFPEMLNLVSAGLLENISDQLKDRHYSTLSAGYALMALDAYLNVTPSAETGDYTVTEVGADKSKRELTSSGGKKFGADYAAGAVNLILENRDMIPLFYQVTQAGFDLEVPSSEIKQGIEIYREFTDATGKKLTAFSLGDTVYVSMNFRTTDGGTVDDVAIVDLLPAGLEADIASIRSGSAEEWTPSYVDIREDRIVVFGTVTGNIRKFTYKTNAINKGTFTVPPLFAEAMYDKRIWALKPQPAISIGSPPVNGVK